MGFGEKLKQSRKESGYTQGDLATRINVTQKDISRWENGVCKPNIDYLTQICTVLNVSADILLGLK